MLNVKATIRVAYELPHAEPKFKACAHATQVLPLHSGPMDYGITPYGSGLGVLGFSALGFRDDN